ncbi:MAG: polysaccharide pyruvyl transferase family protein [Bacteroides sp.]|nr:polysaccharide pyruvyl transferase family protein [Bacteroides sp.]
MNKLINKRVAIVSWIGTGNYGTSLQSYALHEKLKQLGYQVCILREVKCKLWILHIIKSCLKILRKIFLVKKKNSAPKRYSHKLQRFNREKYNVFRLYSFFDYQYLLRHISVFITGSDQVWNTMHHYDPFYFLSFAGKCKRIAYAPSIGTTQVNQTFQDAVKNHLLKYQHIGVREQSAVQILSELTDRNDIAQVVDPTFLLDAKDWRSLAEDAEVELQLPQRYILCYLIGNNDNYLSQLETVKDKLGINNVVIIPSLENSSFTMNGAIIYSNAGPKEFVFLIDKAAYICMDSFHATALSINLCKDFIEFKRFKDNEQCSQNSRIYDLLQHYGLMNRMYDLGNSDLYTSIEYEEIDKEVKHERENCIAYLRNSIEC